MTENTDRTSAASDAAASGSASAAWAATMAEFQSADWFAGGAEAPPAQASSAAVPSTRRAPAPAVPLAAGAVPSTRRVPDSAPQNTALAGQVAAPGVRPVGTTPEPALGLNPRPRARMEPAPRSVEELAAERSTLEAAGRSRAAARAAVSPAASVADVRPTADAPDEETVRETPPAAGETRRRRAAALVMEPTRSAAERPLSRTERRLRQARAEVTAPPSVDLAAMAPAGSEASGVDAAMPGLSETGSLRRRDLYPASRQGQVSDGFVREDPLASPETGFPVSRGIAAVGRPGRRPAVDATGGSPRRVAGPGMGPGASAAALPVVPLTGSAQGWQGAREAVPGSAMPAGAPPARYPSSRSLSGDYPVSRSQLRLVRDRRQVVEPEPPLDQVAPERFSEPPPGLAAGEDLVHYPPSSVPAAPADQGVWEEPGEPLWPQPLAAPEAGAAGAPLIADVWTGVAPPKSITVRPPVQAQAKVDVTGTLGAIAPVEVPIAPAPVQPPAPAPAVPLVETSAPLGAGQEPAASAAAPAGDEASGWADVFDGLPILAGDQALPGFYTFAGRDVAAAPAPPGPGAAAPDFRIPASSPATAAGTGAAAPLSETAPSAGVTPPGPGARGGASVPLNGAGRQAGGAAGPPTAGAFLPLTSGLAGASGIAGAAGAVNAAGPVSAASLASGIGASVPGGPVPAGAPLQATAPRTSASTKAAAQATPRPDVSPSASREPAQTTPAGGPSAQVASKPTGPDGPGPTFVAPQDAVAPAPAAPPPASPPAAAPSSGGPQPPVVSIPGNPVVGGPAASVAMAWAPEAGAPDYQTVLDQPAATIGQADGGDQTASAVGSVAERPAAYSLGSLESLAAPVPAEAAAYAVEATGPEEDEDMGWEEPPKIGPDGRGPWLDGPDAPWGSAPSGAGRRALIAGGVGLGLGAAVALARLFLLG